MGQSRLVRKVFLTIIACGATLAAISGPAVSDTTSWLPVSWAVDAVGPQERSLDLSVTTPARGWCGGRELRIIIRETATNVGINITEAEPPPRPERLGCPEIAYAVHPLQIALAKPLAGRRTYAAPTEVPTPSAGLHESVQVIEDRGGALALGPVTPCLIGFAPADAKRAAEKANLRERIRVRRTRHGLPRVISQSPGPGAPLPQVTGEIDVEIAT